MLVVALAAMAWLSSTAAAEVEYPPAEVVRCVKVIDGDTIKVMREGKVESVRLIGVNAPDRVKDGKREATEFVRGLCLDKDVRLEFDIRRRDRWGRLLGYVFVPGPDGDEIFVNAELLRSGHALFYGYAATHRYTEILRAQFCEQEGSDGAD